jgi:hypothetical protein
MLAMLAAPLSAALRKGWFAKPMETVWRGTQPEADMLLKTLARNCRCEFGLTGARLKTCGPHRILFQDQRALDGLVFMRRQSARLLHEEWAA